MQGLSDFFLCVLFKEVSPPSSCFKVLEVNLMVSVEH